MSNQPTPEQKARGTAMVVSIVRGTGAVLMVAGTAVGFNIGGLATMFGLSADVCGFVGIAIGVAGLVDFFVLPTIIAKANNR